MAEPARYQFDSVFSLAHAREAEPKRYEEPELQAAVEAARQEGIAAGRAAAIAEADQQAAIACGKIVEALPALMAAAEDKVRDSETAIVDIAVLTARKLSRALVARYPLVEIVDLFRQSVEEIRSVPHVALRVHESLAEPLSQRIDGLTRETGIEGRVIVLGDPDIVPGDARLEWADGGMVREAATLEAEIEEAVKRFALRQPQQRPGHDAPMSDTESGAEQTATPPEPRTIRETAAPDTFEPETAEPGAPVPDEPAPDTDVPDTPAPETPEEM